jgi:RNA polymerase sigma factor (sigma-70 family)
MQYHFKYLYPTVNQQFPLKKQLVSPTETFYFLFCCFRTFLIWLTYREFTKGAPFRRKSKLDSFDAVHKQYENMIHKVIHSLNIYKNQDEFYQTGLIALWEAHENFIPEKGAFPAYAFSYIKGRIMTVLTSEHRIGDRNVYKDEEFWELIKDEHHEETLPEDLIRSYCQELTVNQSKWILYTCLNMLTVNEIAEVEGVSTSAVKKWRKGAKERLKQNIIK